MNQPGHHEKSDGEVTISKSDSWSTACHPLDGPMVLLDEVIEVFFLRIKVLALVWILAVRSSFPLPAAARLEREQVIARNRRLCLVQFQ